MEKTFLFLLLTSLSLLTNAKEINKSNSALSKTDFIENICGDMAGFAEVVMQDRQNGVPITDIIQSVNQDMADGVRKNLFKSTVFEAYSEPRWSTEENKRKAVTEFSNQRYLTCIKIFSESFKNIK
jgi:hypothetical protein